LSLKDGVFLSTRHLEALLDGTVADAVVVLCMRAMAATEWPIADASSNPELQAELVLLIPDPERRQQMLLALGRRFDDAHRLLLGEIGEEVVVMALRSELEELGYPELARAVRRVSLESDQLGYDVSAPRVSGPARLLEVKATTRADDESVTVHLTRHEADVGAALGSWALAVCLVTDTAGREGSVLGWCPMSVVDQLLPTDSNGGFWEQTAIAIRYELLHPGLPRAVL
jgi:hypothetical protein